jgi:ABC-2 type transport system ATP-binding protein
MTQDVPVRLQKVSKFFGDVLGINKVNLSITPGITSLVGPNGSGKTTLMNLITGLIQPTEGEILVFGQPPHRPEHLFHLVAYCTQFDSFPKGMTGLSFIAEFLRLHGFTRSDALTRAEEVIAKVGLTEAQHRKVDSYSKGMRQRIRIAQAMAHDPKLLILDEPLNGLDPMARAEVIAVFQDLAAQGYSLLISSHILHEVDMIADRVILINQGYIIAEGALQTVRGEMEQEHPMQFRLRCTKARELTTALWHWDHVLSVTMLQEPGEFLVKSASAERFFQDINQLLSQGHFDLSYMAPHDEDVQSVYDYLIGVSSGGTT